MHESEVAQSCPTLHDPMDCSPTGSSVHGIFQARVLEWVAIAFSNSYTAAAAKLLQSCPTLFDSIDGSPPGSTVPGILQARTLEWVAISFSNAWEWKVKSKSFSRVLLFVITWTSLPHDPPVSDPLGFLIKVQILISIRYWCNHVHISIMHNSQKVDAMQVSINRWIDKQNIICVYTHIIKYYTSLKKKGILIHAITGKKHKDILLLEGEQNGELLDGVSD